MIVVAIPARLQSTRLPNKLLLKETGRPLLWHTVEQVLTAKSPTSIFVLADDQKIVDELEVYQDPRVKVLLTGPADSGTDRISRFVRIMNVEDDHIVVNFQGDEPELPGKYIDDLVENLFQVEVATLAAPATPEEAASNSVVKVVSDMMSNAMYFSRHPIPFGGPWRKHMGIYAYRAGFLKNLDSLPPHPFEAERLEQLRWLHAGAKIRVVLGEKITSVGIDTQEEYDQFVRNFGKH